MSGWDVQKFIWGVMFQNKVFWYINDLKNEKKNDIRVNKQTSPKFDPNQILWLKFAKV